MTEDSSPAHSQPLQSPDIEQRLAQERGRNMSPGRDVLSEQELANVTGSQSSGSEAAAPSSEDIKEGAGGEVDLGGRKAVIGEDIDRENAHASLEQEEDTDAP